MSHVPPQPPAGPPHPPVGPPPAAGQPKWTRKRILIPAVALLFFVGVGIGSAGGEESVATASDSARPAPTVTVTATATAEAEAEPAPAVTKTVTAAPSKAKKAAEKPTEEESAPEGKAVFKVWGSAPAGVDITYGNDGTNLQGTRLPMEKTLTVKDDALYYQVTAQLQGGGDIHCSITIDGKTKTGQAQGGYNICSAQLNSDFTGGFS
ncbi:hypothetical protein [Streptomyces sp. NPDC005805]|uniref:hypothetical protein n=1 Tax=Streptomyces sp. NPDC005805 TaxID=3157068 RepID=UPI0033CDE925